MIPSDKSITSEYKAFALRGFSKQSQARDQGSEELASPLTSTARPWAPVPTGPACPRADSAEWSKPSRWAPRGSTHVPVNQNARNHSIINCGARDGQD